MLVLQGDGRVYLSGYIIDEDQTVTGTYFVRLRGDGSPDPDFNVEADGPVRHVVLQPDGRILVGGSFERIGGQERRQFARLYNTSTARQSLAVGTWSSSVIWSRSGSGPELEWAGFEMSEDGFNYTRLGNATRFPGGWQLGGLTLPAGRVVFIRARGHSGGGRGQQLRLHRRVRPRPPGAPRTATLKPPQGRRPQNGGGARGPKPRAPPPFD